MAWEAEAGCEAGKDWRHSDIDPDVFGGECAHGLSGNGRERPGWCCSN